MAGGEAPIGERTRSAVHLAAQGLARRAAR